MTAESFSIEPGIGYVIGCTEIGEDSCVWFFCIVEGLSVPDTTFVVEEVIALSVPITGYGKVIGCVEGVFEPMAFVFLFEVSVVFHSVASVHGVYDDSPLSVEADFRAAINVCNQVCVW